MGIYVYNQYKELNKDTLLAEDDFLEDASKFLIDRGGYEVKDLQSKEAVYDKYMEHFRSQNVNEATALKDLTYALDAEGESKERFGRLMDTYDKMDSDLGLKAAGDYLEGIFTAPSTYAGAFSFGTAKVGALAAQQGIKLGVRQAQHKLNKCWFKYSNSCRYGWNTRWWHWFYAWKKSSKSQ